MERLSSGESKTIFRNISCTVIIGLTKSGRKAWQEEEETRKKYQYCTDPSGEESLYLRALQGHSGRSLIDPTLQDNVINSEQFLPVHLSSRMCKQFTFHHQFGIDTWRSKFEQQTDSILSRLWNPWTKTIRILTRSTWEHRVLHNTCMKHGRNIRIRCIGSTSNLLNRKE